MAKQKFLYATKMHLYLMVIVLVSMAGILGYQYYMGIEEITVGLVFLPIAMMAAISWLIWKSYKGDIPMMRIEERD